MNIKDKIKKIQSKQSGYTLIELLLVIAIIIALTAVMIYALVGRAERQSAIHQCATAVSQIVIAQRAYNAMDPAEAQIAGSDTFAILKGYGVDSRIVDHNGIKINPWTGDYSFTAPVSGEFTVSVTGLPDGVEKDKSLTVAIQSMTDHDTKADAGGAKDKTVCKGKKGTLTCTFDVA